jgi:hypothetical protein
VITKRDIKVSFISIAVFALIFVLFNQYIDEAAAQRNSQFGQQQGNQSGKVQIDPGATYNVDSATESDVAAIQRELETMQKELQTITEEGSRRGRVICTLLLAHGNNYGLFYEETC